MSDLKTASGTLEITEAVADHTKFKLGGLTIKGWVAGRNPCQTPQDVIVALDKKPAICKYTDFTKGDVTYHNASEVSSYAGAVAPEQSNGDGMSKAEWREKDDRQFAFNRWQSRNRTATDLMIAIIQRQPIIVDLQDIGGDFDTLWKKIRETVDEPTPASRSMGTPTDGQAQTAEQLLITAIAHECALKKWDKVKGKEELDAWADRAGLLNREKIIAEGLRACDAAELGAFLTYLKS